MSGWQNIDNAPKDYIIAWEKTWPHPQVLDWVDFGPFHRPVGWGGKALPTHWMALPNPPSDE